MELSAAIEFAHARHPDEAFKEHALWQFAQDVINKAEYFKSNPRGELEIDAVPQAAG
jgi:hypothetical protein